MSIPFHCPHCQLFTLVEDEYGGLSGPCASCGKLVHVPVSGGAATTAQRAPTVRQKPSMTKVLLIVVACMFASAVLLSLAGLVLMPTIRFAQQRQHKAACGDALRKIGIALNQYHERYGCYPPPYIADSKGTPIHSWRVLILPFLGEQGLYEQYRFDEPWDGPNNLRLSNKMPAIFACAGDEDAQPSATTSYVAITGLKTAFPKTGRVRRTDIRDDESLTILVVELHDSRITWTQPKDIDISALRMNVDGSGGIGGNHSHNGEGGANALMADGSIRFLDDTISDEYLNGMGTIDGNEIIPWDVLD